MRTLIKRTALSAHAALLATAALACMTCTSAASAHAVVGDRVFPATMTVDDPGVSDEFDTQFGHIKSPDDNGDNMNVNTWSYEWDKTIMQNWQFSVSGNYVSQNAPNGGSAKGWDNVTVGTKYMFYANAPHEFMASIGLDSELGGTGAKSIANSYSTISPSIYFGKGFGDLPDALAYLRPMAITAQLSPNVTTTSADQGPNSFFWGLTLQYSIPYLQHQVKDLGLPQPLAGAYFVIEAPMTTCTAGACAGQTTGTINPGVLWLNSWGQFGVEAQIPVNRLTGTHTGILLQAHFFLDDIFPSSIGKPLF
ncbi:MAG TPA: hypothetical protein VMJ11_07535 [Paraburkholderia sp.]|uniref:hypothetical protein n=1 Tax=Paraburkholderia sp. TaxID=1926495 RepID=UPI002CF985F8|nr:hypothetical protein [Paraburkholderia sp.]HTR06499.1 hypothetical protein [Paraburkholderia sp.]